MTDDRTSFDASSDSEAVETAIGLAAETLCRQFRIEFDAALMAMLMVLARETTKAGPRTAGRVMSSAVALTKAKTNGGDIAKAAKALERALLAYSDEIATRAARNEGRAH